MSEIGRVLGRYVLYDAIASGGMATIHLARLLGEVGFAKVVAIKRLHPHLARDPEFVGMFLDEARVAANLSHPNVVTTLDVLAVEGELFLVLEYVEGEALSRLIRFTRKADQLIDPAIVVSIMTGALYGLHAAHNAKDERGKPLGMVHRDVSPQNILVGLDGVARMLDFGVAKAERRLQETEAGRMKGKFSYMAPEMVRQDDLDYRADVFSAGICLWEALTGKFLFAGDEPARTIGRLLEQEIVPPSHVVRGVPSSLDEITLRALERDPNARFQSAREMAIALEDALPPAVPRKVGEWVECHAGPVLRDRRARLEARTADTLPSGPSNLGELQDHLGAAPSVAAHEVVDEELPTRLSDSASIASAAADQGEGSGSASIVAAQSGVDPTTATPLGTAELGTPVSQVSVASYAGPPRRTLAPKIPTAKIALIAGLVASVGLLTLLILVTSRKEATEAPAMTSVASPVTSELPVQPVQKPPEPLVAKSVEPEPPAPVPEPKVEPKKPATTQRPQASASPKPSTPPKDCNPPYTIVNGIKKFKRHCM